jgi:hypothetical protein
MLPCCNINGELLMKTQAERMAIIETNLENIRKEIGEIKAMLTCHIESEDQRVMRLKEEFAAKWVERAVWAMIGAVVLAIITAGVKLVINHGVI